LWEKETTPQMTSIFASNGPQPFTSSTHQRLTFGQHFFGILQYIQIYISFFHNYITKISPEFFAGKTFTAAVKLQPVILQLRHPAHIKK
jgi:hypothetical protein